MAHILIIEDDQILGNILRDKLTKTGYEVELSMDGAVGLNAMKNNHPDLVLLDIMLPTMNGYEILETKLQDPSIKDIPVIVISNSGQPVELERTLKLGVKEYFIKAQFNPDEVLEKVKSMLPHENAAKEINFTGKKILIVEDDTFLSDVLVKKLMDKGGSILHAATGEDAVALATENHPDLILLDLILPGMTGFEVLKQLKAEGATTKEIPVIILSNLSQKEDMEKAADLGAKKFIVKAMSTPADIFDAILSCFPN